jgi:hypothetical protein
MQELEQSYWCGNGKYQEMNDALAKHIPGYGESEDKWIELLRCATNIYYDCYNNGGCNLGVRVSELRQIVQYRPQIVPGLDALLKHGQELFQIFGSCQQSNKSDDYYDDDDDDDRGSMYLSDDWSEANLELLLDAIILLVHQNFKVPVSRNCTCRVV